MAHVINNNGAIATTTPDTENSYFVTDANYIIVMPSEESEMGLEFYGADDQALCVEVMGLILGEEQADYATGKTAIEAANGLVFLDGAQQ